MEAGNTADIDLFKSYIKIKEIKLYILLCNF